MALALDGFAVLRAIGANPGAFPAIDAEASKSARSLVTKQLKARGVDLSIVRAMRNALEGESFVLILDGLNDRDIKALLGKLDKHHPEMKTSTASWKRMHLRALADGRVEPSPKPEKVARQRRKAAAKPKSRASKSPSRDRTKAQGPQFLDLQSMKATRRR